MINLTTNLKLKKPTDEESFDVEHMNYNTDEIDRAIGNLGELKTIEKENLVDSINEVFQNVDNGKSVIASAITNKGVNTSKDDTFMQMATNINRIPIKEVAKPNFAICIGKITATIDKRDFFTEFKLDNGNWQSSNVFANLNPVQSYTFHARKGSYQSSIVITTPKANQSVSVPMQSNLGFDKVTMTVNAGEKIRYSGVEYNSPHTFTGLKALTQYQFYAIKPATNTLNEAISSPLTVTTKAYPTYGFRIDKNNSNPLTRVSYLKDSIGISSATPTSYGDWKDKFIFDRVRPCGFKNGKRTEYINPDDFSKYIDGISVPNDVDIMIEFPKIYWKWTTNSLYVDVELSEYKQDEGFECLAHKVGNKETDKVYIGAYLGYEENGKLRSKIGTSPTASKTISEFRKLAQANGNGYQQYNYYSMFMLQMLFVLMFKSTDSQTSLGNGSGSEITGETYNKGMLFGAPGRSQQIKFLGVEDFWGNMLQWVDGIYCDGRRDILITDNTVFNDNGSGYINHGQDAIGNSITKVNGYIGDIQAGNSTGFIVKDINGSSSTNYCDYASLEYSSYALAGGYGEDGTYAGVFQLSLSRYNYSGGKNVGARLCYI